MAEEVGFDPIRWKRTSSKKQSHGGIKPNPRFRIEGPRNIVGKNCFGMLVNNTYLTASPPTPISVNKDKGFVFLKKWSS